jgi:CPA2 family monovalent cation:H+ antiporter-2
MHQAELILTLAGALSAALVLGYITHRLRLSPIVGYLLAGMAVGPFTPGFVAHRGLAEQLAEVGVILLMFGVGLNFHVKELLEVRRVALPGALVQIVAATALGALVGHAAGWSLAASIVFGLAISVASTVVLLRVLSDADALHTPAGRVAVGWLVIEDVFTVLVLVVLPNFAGGGPKGARAVLVAGALAMVKIAVLVVFTFVVGNRVIPRILELVARTRSRELFTLAVLALALGIAVGAAELFGASMALGAFLAGMVVGQSEFSARAAADALSMRDAFGVLFFVSVGMLFDPAQLLPNAALTLGTLAVILVGKPIAAFAVVRLLRYPVKTGLSVAFALAQIGEFSFILAGLGRELGILPALAHQALVAASVASITLNPLLFRLVGPLSSRWGEREAGELRPREPSAHRAIVVGYGPVGRTLTKLLRENGVEPIVVELNLETVRALRAAGILVVYGDATHPAILEQAGIREAGSLVVAASGSLPEAIVSAAKHANPDIRILARSQYVREVDKAKRAGADVVVAAEIEVAIAMAEALLATLGASGDQLDRVRYRVRAELTAGDQTS